MNGRPGAPARPDARPRWALALALAWLAVVVALAASIPGRLAKTGGLDTSLLSLLPESARDPEVADAVQRVAGASTRQLVYLIGHQDFDVAARAADACKKELTKSSQWLTVAPPVDPAALGSATEFLGTARYGLLTAGDRQALEQGGQPLVDQALTELYQPFGAPKLFELEQDPLGLASHFVLERAQSAGFGIRDGRIVIERDGMSWIMLPAELRSDAMGFSAQQALAPVLSEAAQAARRAGAKQVLRSGFIFHAAEAATHANTEVSTIGLGSLIGVILLMWLPFGSPRPVLLVLLPVGVGTLFAFCVDLWMFDRVHLLTLVFGSSIVGVAEDFGVHFVCGALEKGPFEPWTYMRHIRRGLALALLTTLVGYFALAALPFPGLRQMGLFGAAGLFGGWVTAVLWVPFLAKNLGKGRKVPSFVPALVRMEAAWPRLSGSRVLQVVVGVLCAASLAGFAKVRTIDDVRALYDSVPELSHEDDEVRRVLRLAVGSQFFLVRGASAEELLQREEALTRMLAGERSQGTLDGWQALSDSVPSAKTQAETRDLLQRVVFAPGGAAERLFTTLDDSEALARARAAFAAQTKPLDLPAWLGSPLSAPERHLWLGHDGKAESVVLLRGVPGQSQIERLTRLGASVPGVVLVDQVANISTVLGGFRRALSWFVPVGYVIVALCLSFVYGRSAWRVAAPAALGSAMALGVPALAGKPVTLFDLLALVLVLGIGIDYGIFINEPRGEGFSVAFLSVTLGAASTLLSFGLLATSSTPALANFGMTLLIGIGASWCLTPCFTQIPKPEDRTAPVATGNEIDELRC
jgi:predicted exporter